MYVFVLRVIVLCVAMAANGVNVSELSDAELAHMLRRHGATCGPIVRKIHRYCLSSY